MPKWFIKIVFFLILGLLLFAGITVGLTYFQVQQQPQARSTGPAPTVDATALAKYTPTPGHSVPQNATAVYIAKPTPYVEWTPADAKAFIDAMRPKAYTQTKNLLISSELGAPGAGWQCVQIRTDILGLYTIEGDTFCRISLTWTDWQLVINPEDFEIQVEEGRHVQIPSIDKNGNDYFDERALAKVTVTIKQIGLNSPGTRFDQRFDFYKDVSNAWNLVIDLKAVIQGTDLREKANELTADAPDLALADSFAPLMPDGSRSGEYADRLYETFVESLTTPGEQHVYNSLLDTAVLIAGYRCPEVPTSGQEDCVDHNFAGLESLTIVVPPQPGTPCDWVYADDMKTQVLPDQYCRYTFTATGIGLEALNNLKTTIDRTKLDPKVDYQTLIQKLLSIP